MKTWQAVIFDLDDTLYSERSFVLSGFRAVAAHIAEHVSLPSEDVYQQLEKLFRQGVRGNTFDLWLSEQQLADQIAVHDLVEVYRNHTPDIQPFPGVAHLLEILHQKYRLGLVSDGYLDVQRRKFLALGIAHHFDGVVFSDELGRSSWKPSPAPFVEVSNRLRVIPQRAVYIGDNPLKDFVGPRQLGMSSIWYRNPRGEHSRHELPSRLHQPTMTIHSLDELQEALEELGKRL